MNFYNRMESNKLLKKQGKIPFTEHMTVSKYNIMTLTLLMNLAGAERVSVPDALEVTADIKREIAFYNSTRQDVMKGMQFLV